MAHPFYDQLKAEKAAISDEIEAITAAADEARKELQHLETRAKNGDPVAQATLSAARAKRSALAKRATELARRREKLPSEIRLPVNDETRGAMQRRLGGSTF